MRLWDVRLVKFLPQKQLVGQWREINLIKKGWQDGNLNHGLINYVKEHEKGYFLRYTKHVLEEMSRRNIKYNEKLYKEVAEFCEYEEVYKDYPEHNDVYLRQCLYNLEEKAIRGLISSEEWLKIYERFKMFTDLWKGV